MDVQAQDSKPRLDTAWLPESTVEWILETASLAALGLAVGVLLQEWADLPARVPRHFNFTGKPDAWGSKLNLWVLPLVGAVIYIMLTVVGRIPHTHNFPVNVTTENAPRLYRLSRMMVAWLKLQIACVLSYLAWAQVQVGLGRSRGLGWAFLPVVLIAVGATVYYYLRRIHRAAA